MEILLTEKSENKNKYNCKVKLVGNRCTDVREIWYHKGLFSLVAEALFLVFADGRKPGKEPLLAEKGLLQKQMENSEITIYEGTSPGTKKVSPDFFESQL